MIDASVFAAQVLAWAHVVDKLRSAIELGDGVTPVHAVDVACDLADQMRDVARRMGEQNAAS